VSLSLLAIILSNAVPDSMDSVRIELETRSAFWFGLVKYSGYAVAIGCAMEAPETIILIKRWWLLRFRDEDREETREEKKRWIVPLAATGLLIIVVGIVLETYFEGKVSDVDAELRAHESDKITAAEKEAASATRQAGSAADNAQAAQNSADDAGDSAAEAEADAKDAKGQADAVGEKADDLDRQLASARTQLEVVETKRAELEKSLVNMAVCNAPRVLVDRFTVFAGKVQSNVDPLRPMAGQKVLIEFVPDAEARRAARSLRRALLDAGWDMSSPPQVVDELRDGVSVQSFRARVIEPSQYELDAESRAADVTNKLIDFLHSYNWQAEWGFPIDGHGHMIRDPNIIPVGAIRIQIGLYPAVEYVVPPGGRDISITGANIEQEMQRRRKETREKALKEHPEIAAYLAEDDKRLELEEERRAGPCHAFSGPPIIH
jgi:hypothetical protein